MTVINTFIAKYVGDLRWDYLLIGGECETSRWGPSTWDFDDIQEFTEGICGMICLGRANHCLGWINGMHYQQGVEGEVVCFTHHFDMRPHEHDFELQSVGCLILLGRTCPTLPCTDNGNDILGAVSFKINRESSDESTTTLQQASPASKHVKCDDEETQNRVLTGCTNPGSLLSQKTPWSEGCKVIPIAKNDDWCSIYTLDKCRETLSGRKSALWFSSPCTGGTSWTHVNMHRGSSTVNKVKGHWAEFKKLWKRLEEIACLAIPHGVAILIEWPRGCKYWTTSNVVRFLEKYGFKFADFDGCICTYGLVASHGKGAGLPIKKPLKVAYLNSSPGGFLHLKCDGSHEHSPCSGKNTSDNTSDTERYTPVIAKAAHQRIGRDVRQHCMNCSDTAITIMPAAISVLKLPVSDEHDHWVDLLMANRPSLKRDPAEWPTLGMGAASRSPPRPTGWRRSRMSGVEISDTHT